MMEVIRGSVFEDPVRNQGYLIGYGLNIPNVIMALLCFLLIRDIFFIKTNFLNIFKYKRLLFIFFSTLAFFLISIYSNSRYSPFIVLSTVWLFQYMQMFILASATLYIYKTQTQKFNLIYLIVIITILFQSFLGFQQFLKQANIGLPIEVVHSVFYQTGVDTNPSAYRPSGSFIIHNQLAFIMLLSLIIILPKIFSKQNKLYLFSAIVAVFSIILTQSRSIWLVMLFIFLLLLKQYYQSIHRLISRLDTFRIFIYMIFISVFSFFIILPRIILTLNTAYEGGGLPLRLQQINEGVQILVQNPLVGFGVGTNEYILYSFFPDGIVREFPAPIHMAFLQLALEVGLLGLFFFLFPFLIIIRTIINSALRKVKVTEDRKNYQFTFISGCIAIFIYFLFLAHTGIIEFAYLGLILGFGLISFIEQKYAAV